jgi:hypothetical protein
MIERVAMKFSLKHGLLFMGAQVLLCLALGALAYLLPPYSEPLSAAIFYIYFPTVYGIAQLRLFNGDANMFMPIFFGIPLGIVLYAVIFGYIFGHFKSRRRLP